MRIVLETSRLVLSELSLDDLDFYAAMTGDPYVMRFYRQTMTRDQAAASIRGQMANYFRYGIGAWLAREKSSGRPVGRAGLLPKMLKGISEVELAWMIDRPFQRCSYASEAAAACRDYGLHTLRLPRVIALIRPENLPSAGVARKIGLVPVDRALLAGFEHVVYAKQRAANVSDRIAGE